jgi:hypothetical protein
VHWQTVLLAAFLELRARPAAPRRVPGRGRDHLDERSQGGVSYLESTRHLVEVEHADYIRDLDREIRELDRAADAAPSPPPPASRPAAPPEVSRATDSADPAPPRRPREPVLRRLDWTFPAPPVHRELVEVLPDEPVPAKPPLLFVHGAWHGAWCWQEHWMPAAAEPAGTPTR